MSMKGKSGSMQIVHPLPSAKQLLLSCDKCNEKADIPPSQRETTLNELEIPQVRVHIWAGEGTQSNLLVCSTHTNISYGFLSIPYIFVPILPNSCAHSTQ